MSKSNASAKSRRAFISPQQSNPSIGQQQQQQQQQSSSSTPTTGLTLQQVISVIDKRLLNVETFVKESKEDSNRKIKFEDETEPADVPNNLTEILSEYNSRFDLLAEEISNLKDIVMKLQSYTMDVNKTLMEERIHILSDLGTNTFENPPVSEDSDPQKPSDENDNIQISEVADSVEVMTPPIEPISTSLENLGGPNYRRQRGRN